MTPASELIAQQHRRAFAAELNRPEEEIRLDVAAILIGAEDEAYLDVDVDACLQRISDLGQQARARLIDAPSGLRVEVFNRFMFEEVGFHGDEEDYYDPRNSYLHHVLDRRKGIPITLSVLYMLVGRSAGLEVEGVGLPGHFIVRVGEKELFETTLVDPFNRTTTTLREFQERLRQPELGQSFDEPEEMYDENTYVVTTSRIVQRMLLNLHSIYLNANLHRLALATVERLIIIVKYGDAWQHKDRGELLAELGRLPEAIEEYQAFLKRVEHSGVDHEQYRERLYSLQRQLAMRN